MRVIYFLLLLIFLAAIGIFAWQNQQKAEVRFGVANTQYDWKVEQPISLLSAEIYLLGMLSGWTVVGTLRRTLQRVTERPQS